MEGARELTGQREARHLSCGRQEEEERPGQTGHTAPQDLGLVPRALRVTARSPAGTDPVGSAP